MECKKYNPFVVKSRTKPKPKTKPNTKLEARILSLLNKQKLDIIMLRVLLRQVRKNLGL